MIELIILALALSMDAFAVAIGLGSKRIKRSAVLALVAAFYFGLFQGLMPLLGYLGGRGMYGWVEAYAPWIAFLLLLLIGGKMIVESMSEGIEKDIKAITHKLMLILAIATSVDALAAGFTLTVLPVNPWFACVLIGGTTFVFSAIGVFVGARFGTWLESKAELLGGVVLILVGFKVLLT